MKESTSQTMMAPADIRMGWERLIIIIRRSFLERRLKSRPFIWLTESATVRLLEKFNIQCCDILYSITLISFAIISDYVTTWWRNLHRVWPHCRTSKKRRSAPPRCRIKPPQRGTRRSRRSASIVDSPMCRSKACWRKTGWIAARQKWSSNCLHSWIQKHRFFIYYFF